MVLVPLLGQGESRVKRRMARRRLASHGCKQHREAVAQSTRHGRRGPPGQVPPRQHGGQCRCDGTARQLSGSGPREQGLSVLNEDRQYFANRR